MPPRIDIDSYKDEITTLFQQEHNAESICNILQQRYIIEISPRTLARRLKDWGLRRYAPKTIDNEALHDRIRTLVFDCQTDEKILRVLHREGFQLSLITLRRLRLQLGLRLRTDDPEARSIQAQEIANIIREEIQHGAIEGFGRGLLYTYLRDRRHLFPRYAYSYLLCI